MVEKNVASVLCGALMLAGCGVPDSTAPGEGEGASETEAETGEVLQAWGEGTCGQAVADASWIDLGGSTSPDESYDDPSCRHAYVGRASNVQPHRIARARYAGALPNGTTQPCNSVQARVSLWKEVPPPGQGGAFFPPAQKMGDGPVVYGTPATPPFSGCVAPVSSIAIPESSGDDYLVIGQARSAAPGMTFYQKVTVQMIKQFN